MIYEKIAGSVCNLSLQNWAFLSSWSSSNQTHRILVHPPQPPVHNLNELFLKITNLTNKWIWISAVPAPQHITLWQNPSSPPNLVQLTAQSSFRLDSTHGSRSSTSTFPKWFLWRRLPRRLRRQTRRGPALSNKTARLNGLLARWIPAFRVIWSGYWKQIFKPSQELFSWHARWKNQSWPFAYCPRNCWHSEYNGSINSYQSCSETPSSAVLKTSMMISGLCTAFALTLCNDSFLTPTPKLS